MMPNAVTAFHKYLHKKFTLSIIAKSQNIKQITSKDSQTALVKI